VFRFSRALGRFRKNVTRTDFRFLLIVLLAGAIELLRGGLHDCAPAVLGVSGVALAQPIPDPGFGDPTHLTSDPASGLPPSGAGTNPYLPNATVPSAPHYPAAAVRPASWPGGNPPPQAAQPNVPGGFPANGYRVATTSPPRGAASKESPADPPYDPAEILARVGSERIQACEVLPMINRAIRNAVNDSPEFAKLPPEAQQREIYKAQKAYLQAALKEITGTKLLVSELRGAADKKALDENEKKIRDFFNAQYLKRLQDEYKASSIPDLEDKLRAFGGSIESQRRLFVEQNLASGWLNQQVKHGDKEPTPDEMLAYYRAHLKDWETPARARWEQLTARFANFGSREEARAALARWGNDVLVRGVPFAEVAKAHSQDYAADAGGLHDWASRGSLRSAALDQALFQLPPSVMSRILEDDEGYHIIRIVERTEARTAPFSEAQVDIRKQLHDGGQDQRKKDYIEKLRQRTPIWTVFDGNPLVATTPSTAPVAR
jgi:PPIC-type PPIASE domain